MKLDKDGFRLDPQHARSHSNVSYSDPDAWFYEEKRGLYCVSQYLDVNGHVATQMFIIPKSAIIKYARIAESI